MFAMIANIARTRRSAGNERHCGDKRVEFAATTLERTQHTRDCGHRGCKSSENGKAFFYLPFPVKYLMVILHTQVRCKERAMTAST